MRVGWMRPSWIRRLSATRATSRRTGSNPLTVTTSGVSSMMRSHPVAASKARMFRPSRPMMRPLRSSDGIGTTETVVSAVISDVMRCITVARMRRARASASAVPSTPPSLVLAAPARRATPRPVGRAGSRAPPPWTWRRSAPAPLARSFGPPPAPLARSFGPPPAPLARSSGPPPARAHARRAVSGGRELTAPLRSSPSARRSSASSRCSSRRSVRPASRRWSRSSSSASLR